MIPTCFGLRLRILTQLRKQTKLRTVLLVANDLSDEFQGMVKRWLLANPMRTTLYGQWITLVNNDDGVEAYSRWFAEQVVRCAEWNDANPE